MQQHYEVFGSFKASEPSSALTCGRELGIHVILFFGNHSPRGKKIMLP